MISLFYMFSSKFIILCFQILRMVEGKRRELEKIYERSQREGIAKKYVIIYLYIDLMSINFP